MPITVDGVEVTETPLWCDRPSALTGTCETGEPSGAVRGHPPRRLPPPRGRFVNFCRDGSQGLIGHNSETGATCFFHVSQRYPTRCGTRSRDPDYDDYWQPAAVVAADNCQGCHQADPWLHSPWIDQLRDPSDPTQPLVPVVEGKDAPYIVVGADFAQPFHEGAPDNSCTSCHRAQCDNGFAEPLGQLVMPGPFAESRHPEVSDDLRAVRAWCRPPERGRGRARRQPGRGQRLRRLHRLSGCSDTECAASCATAHLEGAPLATAQALLACMDAAGCRLDDEACIFGACPDRPGLLRGLWVRLGGDDLFPHPTAPGWVHTRARGAAAPTQSQLWA